MNKLKQTNTVRVIHSIPQEQLTARRIKEREELLLRLAIMAERRKQIKEKSLVN